MPDKFQTMVLPPISAGMNTTVNSSSLNDKEGRQLLNMEYELDDMPQSRLGATCWSEESEANHKWTGRGTGLAYFKNANTPTEGVLIGATRDKVYRSNTTVNDKSYTEIQGTLNIEDDVDWQFVQFHQSTDYSGLGIPGDTLLLLCLADQGTSLTGGLFNNMAAWPGSGDLKVNTTMNSVWTTMIEMNRRMFYVHKLVPNRLMWSRLGDAFNITADATAAGAGVVYLQKDVIGLAKTRERLFILHRDSISQMKFGEPETNQNLFQIELLTSDGGCINKNCIIPVLDDVFFLSDYGWVSMKAVQQLGDFKQALISDRILALRNTPRRGADGDLNCHRAINYYEKSQVWLSVPAISEPEEQRRYNKEVYVMSYRPDFSGNLGADYRFSRFTGIPSGSNFCIGTYKNRRRLFFQKDIPMSIPTGLAGLATTGGTMPNGTYYFKIVALDQYGEETLPSAEVSVVLSGANDRASLSWSAHPNAEGIRIYKGDSSNDENLYVDIGATTSYDWDTDSGAIAGTLPAQSLAKISNIFLHGEDDKLDDDVTKYGGVAVTQNFNSSVETKDYVFGNEGIQKIGDYWSALIKVFGESLSLIVSWIFDYNPNRVKTVDFSLEKPPEDEWDESNWDEATWAIGASEFQKISHRFYSENTGRVFNSVRMVFKNLASQRWGFRGLSMDVAGLDEKESSDQL